MNTDDQPVGPLPARDEPSDPLRIQDPAISQPPAAPGAAGPALTPGAGSPLQPGPPMSVEPPVRDTTINRAALLYGVVGLVVLVIVVIILIAILHH